MYQLDKYTVALLHFDGTLVDESGKVWTAKNGAATSATKSKVGGQSLYLNGSNQWLSTENSTDFDFGSSDFTIDWWEYREKSNQYGTVFARNLSVYTNILVGNNIGGIITCYLSSNGGGWDIASGQSMGTAILNQWVHYAVVRSGNTFYAFQNGVQKSTWTSSIPFAPSTGTPVIGSNDGNLFGGYIDELRISRVARWTAPFDPNQESPVPQQAPTNLTATAGDSQVALSWTAVSGATGYNVKRSTTLGGSYTTIANNVSGTAYVDTAVTNGTTYYYVVTAITAAGESGNSNEASATPNKSTVPGTTGNVLLRIVMNDSSEREYCMKSEEAMVFVNWYKQIASTTNNACYTFSDLIDGSTEYLAFAKIISFKVLALAAK